MNDRDKLLSAITAQAQLRGRVDVMFDVLGESHSRVGDAWDAVQALFDEVEAALVSAFKASSHD